MSESDADPGKPYRLRGERNRDFAPIAPSTVFLFILRKDRITKLEIPRCTRYTQPSPHRSIPLCATRTLRNPPFHDEKSCVLTRDALYAPRQRLVTRNSAPSHCNERFDCTRKKVGRGSSEAWALDPSANRAGWSAATPGMLSEAWRSKEWVSSYTSQRVDSRLRRVGHESATG